MTHNDCRACPADYLILGIGTPEHPIAPISCSISGMPPREATIPSNVIK
jgi:hypothetical protein